MTFSDRNEIINSIVTIICLVLLAFPIISFSIVKKIKHKLTDESFMSKYGGFFENLNINSHYAIYYNCIFLSKRLLVAFAIVYLKNDTVA